MNNEFINISSEKIIKYEGLFSYNNYNGILKNDFSIINGENNIILSAPHSTNHYRNGSVKYADIFTGGMARYIQKNTNCHLICTTNQSFNDHNFDFNENDTYKQKLKKYIEKNNIKMLIDLHGASKSREYSVELGTIDNENSSLLKYKFIENIIKKELEKNINAVKPQIAEEIPIAVVKNQIFTASNPNTITNFISKENKIPCIQIEVNKYYRSFDNNDFKTSSMAVTQSLINIINTLSKMDFQMYI